VAASTGAQHENRDVTGALRPAARPGGPTTTRTLLTALTVAAVAELLLLRTATRTFIHIPGLAEHERLLGAVAQAGRAAYYLAVVLTVAVLACLARHAHRSGHHGLLTAIGGLLAAAVGLRTGAIDDLPAALVVLAAAGVAGTMLWRSSRTTAERLPFAAFTVAFLLAGAHTAAQFASSAGVALPDTSWLVLSAELVAVLGALLTPGLVRARSHRVAVGIGATAALLTFGALAAGGATLRILMLWNLGLAGWLPDLVYALAAGALAYTVTAAARTGHRTTALAVTLLTCAGIGLHSTYQTALPVIALAAITLTARPHDVAATPQRQSSTPDLPAPTETTPRAIGAGR
jgi:hypothetical protein